MRFSIKYEIEQICIERSEMFLVVKQMIYYLWDFPIGLAVIENLFYFSQGFTVTNELLHRLCMFLKWELRQIFLFYRISQAN